MGRTMYYRGIVKGGIQKGVYGQITYTVGTRSEYCKGMKIVK